MNIRKTFVKLTRKFPSEIPQLSETLIVTICRLVISRERAREELGIYSPRSSDHYVNFVLRKLF